MARGRANPKLPVVHTGRPGMPPYSDAVRRRIVAALKRGATKTAAAAMAGVHIDSVYTWMKHDEAFRRAVEDAEGTAEFAMSDVIYAEARRGNTKAAMFWLERRRPSAWRERVQLLEPDPDITDIIEESMDDDDIRRRLADIAREALDLAGGGEGGAGDGPAPEAGAD